MKSRDIQKVVISKWQNGDKPKKIWDDLAGAVSLRTMEGWVKMIGETGTINLSTPPGRSRSVRTKKLVQDVKKLFKKGEFGKKRMSTRKRSQKVEKIP